MASSKPNHLPTHDVILAGRRRVVEQAIVLAKVIKVHDQPRLLLVHHSAHFFGVVAEAVLCHKRNARSREALRVGRARISSRDAPHSPGMPGSSSCCGGRPRPARPGAAPCLVVCPFDRPIGKAVRAQLHSTNEPVFLNLGLEILNFEKQRSQKKQI